MYRKIGRATNFVFQTTKRKGAVNSTAPGADHLGCQATRIYFGASVAGAGVAAASGAGVAAAGSAAGAGSAGGGTSPGRVAAAGGVLDGLGVAACPHPKVTNPMTAKRPKIPLFIAFSHF